VSDLTVFIGPQATGKSLTAQILCFFRRLEQLVLETGSKEKDVRSALEQWLGNKLKVYLNSQTTLCWSHPDVSDGMPQEIICTRQGIDLNQALRRRLQNRAERNKADIYIPSGRALYAFLPPYAVVAGSRFIKSQDWPGYVSEFYGTLGRTIKWLHENPEVVDRAETQFLRGRIQKIIKGQLSYGAETVSLKIDQEKTITPTTMAAGQMEIWPFWAIVEEAISSDKTKLSRLYFDEPEAHLHPAAQKAVVEIIAYLVRQQGIQFVLTTHSPYILYAINVLLKANEVKGAARPLPSTVPQESVLPPAQVAAYRFSPDGIAYGIKDTETNLIDEDEFDRVADELGATFTELLEDSMKLAR
jgi:hypothetical protein